MPSPPKGDCKVLVNLLQFGSTYAIIDSEINERD